MSLSIDQIRAALRLMIENKQPDQTTIKLLLRQRYIEARDVTNNDSPPGQREYLATFITEKGRRVLEG